MWLPLLVVPFLIILGMIILALGLNGMRDAKTMPRLDRYFYVALSGLLLTFVTIIGTMVGLLIWKFIL